MAAMMSRNAAEFGDHFGCPDGLVRSAVSVQSWNLTRKPPLRLKTAFGPEGPENARRACRTN